MSPILATSIPTRPARRLSHSLLPTLLLAFTACAAAPQKPTSLVLIVVDTLRADHLSAYGYSKPTSPNLDSLARRGVLFRSVVAASPWTGPSVASIVTGRLPDELGMQKLIDPLPTEAFTLPEILGEQAYWTGAVISNAFAGPDYHHDQGYQHFVFKPYKEKVDLSAETPQGRPLFTAEQVTDEAIELLAKRSDPFFLYVHYSDPHDPYMAPEEWQDRFLPEGQRLPDNELLLLQLFAKDFERDRLELLHAHYDAEIAFVDQEIGRLLKELPDDTLVVVTSDHGEAFLERGLFGHGHSLHEELLHVPMIWCGPGAKAGGETARPVSHVDILPTLLEVLGVEVPEPVSGHSFAWALDDSREPPSSNLVFSVLGSGWNRGSAARDARWKLIETQRGQQLFDLATDADETRDVSEQHPEVKQRLAASLQERRAGERPSSPRAAPEIESRRKAALRSLGYIE